MPDENSAPDAAHVLFPSDKPAVPNREPEWVAAQRIEAQRRLQGQHPGKPAAPASPEVKPDAGKDDAAKLFAADANAAGEFNSTETDSFFNTYKLNAIKDQDPDRAEAIGAAHEALVANVKAAGTPTDEWNAAQAIVRERVGALSLPSVELIQAEEAKTTEALMAEYGDAAKFNSDLAAANKFIEDLDKVSPGLIATLNHSGAGNDPKLVRAAIKEARRRGY
ncbi:hypothetical protein [Hyphomicrobium sp. CS1BSMeth3]|uniref:hypothetical protein n=1 Tax=Hyphomicrobium sp. CS1BSMeth3 TaxID=1892844 RepID=UPI0009313136|nr:hypothetical protein [Hyphomicrobium sp. CS1BSMeth3]